WSSDVCSSDLQEKHVSHKFQGKETVESRAFESPNHLWGAQLGTPVLHRHNPLPTTDEEKEKDLHPTDENQAAIDMLPNQPVHTIPTTSKWNKTGSHGFHYTPSEVPLLNAVGESAPFPKLELFRYNFLRHYIPAVRMPPASIQPFSSPAGAL